MKIIATLLLALALLPAHAAPSLIPIPEQMTVEAGVFTLDRDTGINADSKFKSAAKELAARLQGGTGFPFKSVSSHHQGKKIVLTSEGADPALGMEGYTLDITPDKVTIHATAAAGAFYGGMTLLQLFPSGILTNSNTGQLYTAPCLHIVDHPRFSWRGLMLDVSRHFYTKTEVEKIIDTMALYKLNTFHWHLVDDQGWRIEIKKYPLLTQKAAWRNGIDFGLDPKASTAYRADGKYGGFYTQADIREVVKFAAARHITIVPEIEMPGHSAGALAPYPQYSCFGGPYNNDGDDAIFCPGNEETFVFLQNVLTEVFALFPSPLIHIGGDEVSTADWKKCPKCQARMKEQGLTHELQLEGYLIQRIEKFANAHGKRLIGWSEIRDAGLAPNAAVMDWIGGATEAASAGHDVVLSPAAPVDYGYFDHYQSKDQSTEPHAIGGFLPLRQVYSFEPIPKALPAQFQKHILGGQGNLWTEFVPNLHHAEYMIFPRELAMAEVLWSPTNTRQWNKFLVRVKDNEARLDALGVNYRKNPTQTGQKSK